MIFGWMGGNYRRRVRNCGPCRRQGSRAAATAGAKVTPRTCVSFANKLSKGALGIDTKLNPCSYISSVEAWLFFAPALPSSLGPWGRLGARLWGLWAFSFRWWGSRGLTGNLAARTRVSDSREKLDTGNTGKRQI